MSFSSETWPRTPSVTRYEKRFEGTSYKEKAKLKISHWALQLKSIAEL